MANGKPSIVNFVPKSLYDDGFSISDKASKLKVKEDVTKRIPKINKPGNWDSEITSSNPPPSQTEPQRLTAFKTNSKMPAYQRGLWPKYLSNQPKPSPTAAQWTTNST